MGKQRRRTTAERAALVASWRRSGKSRRAFARELGVAANTLYRWIREASREPEFVEVLSMPEPRPAVNPFVVTLSGGLRVEVPVGFEASELRRLVDALC